MREQKNADVFFPFPHILLKFEQHSQQLNKICSSVIAPAYSSGFAISVGAMQVLKNYLNKDPTRWRWQIDVRDHRTKSSKEIYKDKEEILQEGMIWNPSKPKTWQKTIKKKRNSIFQCSKSANSLKSVSKLQIKRLCALHQIDAKSWINIILNQA